MEYKYETFGRKSRPSKQSENDYIPMSVASDKISEMPYNDENDVNSKSNGGALPELVSDKKPKKPKSLQSMAQSSIASEESSVPPPRSGFYDPNAKKDSDSDDSSVPSGKSGYYEPRNKEPKPKRQWKFPKFSGRTKAVNMAGDIEENDRSSKLPSESSVTSEESVEWMDQKVLIVLAVVVSVLFILLIVVVALAVEDSLEPDPTGPPTMPPTKAPTTMPSKAPTGVPTVKPRDPIPTYATYFSDFRKSVQTNQRQGYLATLDDSSPQSQAFLWVIRSSSSCCSYPTLAPLFLFERYIVTTILFGTQDGYPWPENWRNEWKEKSVCDWRNPFGIGVFCNAGGLIRELSLRNLYVADEFPPEVGLLNDLQVLSLASWDGIGFTIPMEVGRLKNLEFLKISSTENLKGTIPTEVGELTKLTILSLRDNHLDGTVPSEVGNLSILQTLQLDNNSFTGTLPDEIGRLGTLQHLVLSHNGFNSRIPDEINQLTSLEELRLDKNMFSGAIPNNFQSLTGLRWLNLESNVDGNGNVLLQGNLDPLCDAGGGQLFLNFKADCNSDKITCYCCFCFG